MEGLELICRFEEVAEGGCEVLVRWCNVPLVFWEKRGKHICACALNADDIDISHVVVLARGGQKRRWMEKR